MIKLITKIQWIFFLIELIIFSLIAYFLRNNKEVFIGVFALIILAIYLLINSSNVGEHIANKAEQKLKTTNKEILKLQMESANKLETTTFTFGVGLLIPGILSNPINYSIILIGSLMITISSFIQFAFYAPRYELLIRKEEINELINKK